MRSGPPTTVLAMPLAHAGESGLLRRTVLEGGSVDHAGWTEAVERSLLTGPEGSAIVLVNHTYKPIRRLRIGLRPPHPVRTAISTEGAEVALKRTLTIHADRTGNAAGVDGYCIVAQVVSPPGASGRLCGPFAGVAGLASLG